MNTTFNRVIWKKSEDYIRKNYAGKLVYKGCEYDNTHIRSATNKTLYIPVGCYYVILENSKLLDYGYYHNSGNLQEKINKFPYWVKCVEYPNIFNSYCMYINCIYYDYKY